MRVAALYDIHGNLPALRAVLADAAREGVDTFVIGGDVADGPMPRETLNELARLGPHFVLGNTDREVMDAYDRGASDPQAEQDPASRVVAFAAGQILPEQRHMLGSFSPLVRIEVDGLGPVLFCHGSPRSDTEIITRLTPEARLHRVLEEVEEPVVVCGHIHQSYDRSLGARRIVNPGSVGLPYEGEPGAYWALLGPDVQLRRTTYDVAESVRAMRATGLPEPDELLHDSLIEPADPRDVAELFEGQVRLSRPEAV